MNMIILEDCVIYRANNFEEIIGVLKMYDKMGITVIIKFSLELGITLILDKINLEEVDEDFGKQSRVVINNIQITNYKIDKDIEMLSDKEVELFSSKDIMLIKNRDNNKYYLINKGKYNFRSYKD